MKINYVEPSYFKLLGKDASLNAKDFALALGISKTTLWVRVHKGLIPKPDWLNKDHFTMKNPSGEWKISTVRKFFADMKKTQTEVNCAKGESRG